MLLLSPTGSHQLVPRRNHSRVCMSRRSCGAHIKENTFAGKAQQSWQNYHHVCSLKCSQHPACDHSEIPRDSLHLKCGNSPFQSGRMPQLLEPQLDISCTVSQNNFQQPRERDVLPMTHAVLVEEENNNSALQTTWCEPETGKVWSATKQTNHLKSMLWKIKMYLSEMSDMNDAERKILSHIFYKYEPRAENIYNVCVCVCVYFCRKNLQITALTIKTKRI